MDISIRYNWSDKKDKLENELGGFKREGGIKNWEFTESFDESLVGKKGWYKTWINNSIIIYPTDNLLEGYKETVELSSQAIQDQTVLEMIHQMSQGNTLLRTEAEKFSKSIDSVKREPASTVEAKVLEQLPKKRILENNEHTKTLKIEQQAFDFDAKEEIELSPETMKAMINRLNMSIRQVATEIGIAHTTLSRYLRNENKRQNNKNDEKMINWMKEKTLTNV